MDRHLPHSLFDQGGVKKSLHWCERYLALCALLMAWSMADVLADRFDEARRVVVKMFPGRKRPGKTYTGFVEALGKKSDALLAKIAEHLRGEVRRVAGERHWEYLGFVPIGADGSKVECPKTLANEQAFGCAGKKKSTPQQFVTTLLHLPTGCAFHPRCPRFEGEQCRLVVPALIAFNDGSAVACHPVAREHGYADAAASGGLEKVM